jgi:hypothetical protein
MQPIFDRLGNENFLAGCEKGLTQNANECLHHVIWGMAPKGCFNSPQEISTAIYLGVLQFNSGIQKTCSNLLSALEFELQPEVTKTWHKIDDERVYLSEYKSSEVVKKRRKQKEATKARCICTRRGNNLQVSIISPY